jgi:CheY-like chemotaxis protein
MHMQHADTIRHDISSRVLCIDAESENHTLVASTLAPHADIELRIALNGHSGLRAIESSMPDLILLNMNLPDMGGMDVVRSLQPHMADGACRVIALTSEAFSLDIVKALSLGVSEYWLKPLPPELVGKNLLRLLNVPSPKAERPAPRGSWLNRGQGSRSADLGSAAAP